MPTIAVIPITTPTIVKAERILFARSVCNAMNPISLNSAIRSFKSFLSERFDRTQAGRTQCRIQAENQTNDTRHTDAKNS